LLLISEKTWTSYRGSHCVPETGCFDLQSESPVHCGSEKGFQLFTREFGAEPELIINRMDNNSLVTMTEVEKALGRPYFVLPDAREARDAIDQGKLVIDAYPAAILQRTSQIGYARLGKQKPEKRETAIS